jgi:predicted small lipoprotein YifL
MQRFCALRSGIFRPGILLLLLTLSSSILTGCGNKGPLYLPPEPVQEISPAADDESADGENAETASAE